MMTKEKLIVALDFPEISAAKNLVEQLGSEVVFYKIGLEMLMSGDYFELVKFLKSKGKKIFADLKFHDISETVARAVANIAQYEVDLLTIHAGSRDIMRRAAESKGKVRVIAIAALTNLDQKDLIEMGSDPKISLEELVIKRTAIALESGLDGVVSSALEAKILRQNFGKDFLIVTPGIRLTALSGDDQKRVTDVKTALTNGSSYLVVGRPITRDVNPRAAAQQFNQLIHEAFTTSFAS
jgi:orotidine-5'-phosphate decarboxylase